MQWNRTSRTVNDVTEGFPRASRGLTERLLEGFPRASQGLPEGFVKIWKLPSPCKIIDVPHWTYNTYILTKLMWNEKIESLDFVACALLKKSCFFRKFHPKFPIDSITNVTPCIQVKVSNLQVKILKFKIKMEAQQ